MPLFASGGSVRIIEECDVSVRVLQPSKIIIVVLTHLDDSIGVRRGRDSNQVSSLASKVKVIPLGTAIIAKVSGEEEFFDHGAFDQIRVSSVFHVIH